VSGAVAMISYEDFLARKMAQPTAVGLSTIPALPGALPSPAANPSSAAHALPTTATKDAPFVNSLGMRFVPVPILGGPTGGQRVLFCIWVTRVQDFEVFARETKREWPKPNFEQGPEHPAVMVTWEDAQLFCQWLTAREHASGHLPVEWRFRLPTDHEWSCAVELGAKEDGAKQPGENDAKVIDVFPWGTQWPPPPTAGNYAGAELQPDLTAGKFAWCKGVIAGYNDGFANTSPVGSFKPNRFGLYDISGNAWQWCEDWYDKDHRDHVLRGASWDIHDREMLLSSRRYHIIANHRYPVLGFRCVVGASAR